VQNRKEYKHFKNMATDDKSWAIFDSRQGILRTMGHVSIGYQRHAHSHFGLIDGHIAICAWARFIANETRKTAEEPNYEVFHLIIDSLFVTNKADATYHEHFVLAILVGHDEGFSTEQELPTFISNRITNLGIGFFTAHG
jgi:DNA polymerase elongation subunit (family B)